MSVDLKEFADIEGTPQSDFEVIPDGWYTVEIANAESRVASSGNGEYLQIDFVLVDAKHAGRHVWERLNLWHSSEKAVKVAGNILKSIAANAGISRLENSDQLIGKQLEAKITVENSADYGAQNRIKSFRIHQSSSGNSQPAKPSAAPTAHQSTKRPWENI